MLAKVFEIYLFVNWWLISYYLAAQYVQSKSWIADVK